jgi:DNA-directed RNA polymerase specialized sigma subunit
MRQQASVIEQDGLTPDQWEMVSSNLGLIGWTVNRYGAGFDMCEQEEMHSDGMFGLMRAVQKFEPSRGFKFSTYAVFQIRASIQKGVGKRNGVDYRRVQAGRDNGRGWEPTLSFCAVNEEGEELDNSPATDEDVSDDVATGIVVEGYRQVMLDLARDDIDIAVIEWIVYGRSAHLSTISEIARHHGVANQTIRNRRERILRATRGILVD